ncbi:CHAD domain-containing protein [Dongia sp.]|uniref:CYTH and CHAD domain-containing protein n=1 Tax=Dongia sp. TaxID=1977262 RepID=UPI0037510908
MLLPPDTAAGILRRPALRSLLAPAEAVATAEPAANAGVEPEPEPSLAGLHRARLESTYYDTADQWLSGQRMALRVRKIGRKRIQTLKAPAPGPGGLQNFQEIEAEIDSDRPQLSAVTDPKLARKLERENIWRRLRPIFETRFQRSAFLTERGSSMIEVAVDLGTITAGGRRLPIAEIELELKSGDPAALYDLAEQLALQLAEEVPVRLGAETKAARGYALADGRDPEPHKAQPITLSPELSTEEAFVAIVNNCLDQLRANEEAVLSTEDDEAIHQFRVALRRLRAIVSAFRDLVDDDVQAMISIDLRWMQRQFGPARDLDVLIAETLQPIHNRLRAQPAFEQLMETAETARAEARRAAHLAIENPRYVAMLIQLYRQLHSGDWRRASARARLGAPVGDFARPLLQSRHKRLMRLGGRYDLLPEPELHRLRILAKKMRYAAEAFHSLFKPKPTKKYIASLTAIQDSLGSLNDAFVSRQVLSALAQRLMVDRGMAAADANLLQGLVLGWQTARIDRDLAGFEGVWKSFADEKRFWNDAKG